MSEVFTTSYTINYTDQDTGVVNRIINSLKTLSPEDFMNGKITLEANAETDAIDVLLGDNQNFIYFESDIPINYQINADGNEIQNTTIFLHYGEKIDLYLHNPDTENDATVKYVIMSFEE
jgi:hypothetical protein